MRNLVVSVERTALAPTFRSFRLKVISVPPVR